MKITIPGRGPITIYSNTKMFIDISDDGFIETVKTPVVGGLPDTVWVDGAGNYWVDGVGNYWVSSV